MNTPHPSSATRVERDSMGEVAVPGDALYGAQTQRAVQNFGIAQRPLPRAFVEALLLQKAAAARANAALGQLPGEVAEAIAQCAIGLSESPGLMAHFPIDVSQTGSGTSSNMNANEVLARLASQQLGGREISPNDHVNASQSSNDSIPTVLHLSAALALHEELLPALDALQATLATRMADAGHHLKTGRTHLMDAMPLRLGQELGGWAAQLRARREQLQDLLNGPLSALAQGGTAVGTGVNAPAGFAERFAVELSQLSGLSLRPAPDFFAALSSVDTAVALSGALKALAVTLMKIANDLRWMNSGPLAGLAEITLPALQPGSSIMPGKVNPVVPEAVAMACAQVIGWDTAITVAGQSGNFQLNVMLPLVATNLLDATAWLARACRSLDEQALRGFRVNDEALQRALARNPILVTALNARIGYLRAAEIAKAAYAQGRPILDVAAEMTPLSREELQTLLDPARLAAPEPPPR